MYEQFVSASIRVHPRLIMAASLRSLWQILSGVLDRRTTKEKNCEKEHHLSFHSVSCDSDRGADVGRDCRVGPEFELVNDDE